MFHGTRLLRARQSKREKYLGTRQPGEDWQARRESNPQPAVLETAALPIELLAYLTLRAPHGAHVSKTTEPRPLEERSRLVYFDTAYSTIFATTPAPTVRPPSRIAKRRPSSMAIGAISVTSIFTLSPGITISTPSGSSQEPVTSVVRK